MDTRIDATSKHHGCDLQMPTGVLSWGSLSTSPARSANRQRTLTPEEHMHTASLPLLLMQDKFANTHTLHWTPTGPWRADKTSILSPTQTEIYQNTWR